MKANILFQSFFAAFIATLTAVSFAFDGDLLDVRDSADAPIPVIFDTDIGGDIDDAFALALLHVFEDRGVCKLLGVTTTDSHPAVGGYVAAFNARYGRPTIPVGRGEGRKDDNYLSEITSQRDASGELEYPIPEGFEGREAVPLLRELLADADEHSVVIIQVGRCSNLGFLNPGDEVSPYRSPKKEGPARFRHGRRVCRRSSATTYASIDGILSTAFPRREARSRVARSIVFSGYEIGDRVRMVPSISSAITRGGQNPPFLQYWAARRRQGFIIVGRPGT